MAKVDLSVLDTIAGKFAGIVNKLLQAIGKRGGGLEDVFRLDSSEGEETIGKIAALIVGIVANLVYDKRKDGWKLLEHAPRRINSVDGLKLIPVLKSGEDHVNGEEMVRRARVELNANFGQEDAEWLLEHQDLIPKEWRNYYISFPETVWRDSHGLRRVPDLSWHRRRWYLRFCWLEHDWSSSDRLLSSSK